MAKGLDEYTARLMIDGMVDIHHPSSVEVKIRVDGKVIWVNVNGICKLRANVSDLVLVDRRPHDNSLDVIKAQSGDVGE